METWYGKVIEFMGGAEVPKDQEDLNAADYDRKALEVVVQWFWSQKDLQREVFPFINADKLDLIKDALGRDEYVWGLSRDRINPDSIQGNCPSVSCI